MIAMCGGGVDRIRFAVLFRLHPDLPGCFAAADAVPESMFDKRTRQAIAHTRHCLTGCGLGEVTGMAIAQNWSNALQTVLAVALAFLFGYSLTFLGARKTMSVRDAVKLALAVDTISIISMEIIDNVSEWLIPGAMNAKLGDGLFWWSLALSLAIAFVVTVPVNRFAMSRGIGGHHH